MIIFGFLLMVLYVPGILDAATEPRWILIFLTMAVLACFRTVTKVTTGHLLGLGILFYAVTSISWALSSYDSLLALSRLLCLALVFCVGAETTDIRPLLKGMAIGAAVNSVIVIIQWGWEHSLQQWIGENNSPAGLFVQGNLLPEVTAMILVGLVGYRLWAYIPGLLPALLLQGARGALASLVVVGIIWTWQKTKWLAMALAILLVLIIAVTVSVRLHNNSIGDRLSMWLPTLKSLTPFGAGIGSFYSTFPTLGSNFNLFELRPDHVHNDLLELTYELGLGVAFVLAWLAVVFAGSLGPERAMFAVFLLEGITGFPLHVPATAFLAVLCAGRLCRSCDPVRDAVLNGRVLLYARCRGWPAQGAIRSAHQRSPGFSP